MEKIEDKVGKRKNTSEDQKIVNLFIKNSQIFEGLSKHEIQNLVNQIRLKRISKIQKISFKDLESKQNKAYLTNYCFLYSNYVLFLVENNYKNVVIDTFYPYELIDFELLKVVPEGSFIIPRKTIIFMIPDNTQTNQLFRRRIEENKKKRIRQKYLELANYKSLDSLNKLLYFLYSYAKRAKNNNYYLLINNKKWISYIIGNSHEVIVRNFKKIQRMNYIQQGKDGIKIDIQRLEQWAKKLKIIQ
ncbi:MAG: hypothetical protein ABDH21_03200 [bacterium]